MAKYSVFNKSSEEMGECESDSIDLIITSPPYNIGTAYNENPDDSAFSEYLKVLEKVFSECVRVLNPIGKMVIEAADSLYSKDGYIQLAALITDIITKKHGHLVARDINFVNAENGVESPDHGWGDNFVTKNPAHSNCQHWLVFAKGQGDFAETGEIHYLNYLPSDGHPCPFPDKTCDFFLSRFFKTGQVVLDPFMGIAVIGAEVLQRGGYFKGYEIDAAIFNNANERLKRCVEE